MDIALLHGIQVGSLLECHAVLSLLCYVCVQGFVSLLCTLIEAVVVTLIHPLFPQYIWILLLELLTLYLNFYNIKMTKND